MMYASQQGPGEKISELKLRTDTEIVQAVDGNQFSDNRHPFSVCTKVAKLQ
jgi:hypothetical protein